MAKIPVAELQQLLDRQRNCFDGYQQGNERIAKGDLEHFAIMSHVTLCCLLMKLIDAHTGSQQDPGEYCSAGILPPGRGNKSGLRIVDDDDEPPPAA